MFGPHLCGDELLHLMGFLGGLGKEPACQCRRCGFDLWVGKVPSRRKWHLLQYSCLEDSMEREAWWTRVRGVTKSQTRLSEQAHTGTISRRTHPATLEKERLSEFVPPTSLEANRLKKSSWGVLFTGIVGGTLVAVYAVATPFITPALRRICLPFVPATTKQIENVVKMLQCRRGPLVDIGSGDGRIVIAAAKEGFTAVGYELNPWLVWYSRYRAWREGVQASARFYISDLWKVTFSQYSNVVIFGVPQMMAQLEEKLELELKDDARVIACRFPFPHWTPVQVTGEGLDTVWAYDARCFRGRDGRP